MNKEYLELLINNAIRNGVVDRFNIIQQNTSFKQGAFLTHKKFDLAFSLLMSHKESIDDTTFELIHKFYYFIERISSDKHQFYIDCMSLLTDYINICIPSKN